MRPCAECGKPFEPSRANVVACSDTCRTARRRHRHRAASAAYRRRGPADLTPRPCAACCAEFMPTHRGHRYCADPCARAGRAALAAGVDERSYWLLLASQGHASTCAICGASEALALDHCHTEGAPRGLLCSNCNTGLGLFADDPARLRAAAAYAARGAALVAGGALAI